ncbi:MAG: SOUL heme-binding protein [Gimesia sp.]|uniref:SOUL heme-binding protein n=1 Tax=Gimesia maris TaxID=122 RepID=A0A3D3R731_9PLAN|nr:SOUL heme-binding protein [Gimesia sp.]HCO24386.1 SOUL heme-binding protein [Gimesia maris]|tara:strand:+ start:31595 stop:32248 length:654 start_codon:yes stop_codon:yes gene_type:complete
MEQQSRKNPGMTGKKMIYLGIATVLCILLYFGWKFTARNAYESARYTVIESSGPFEIREYPDLMLVSTDSKAQPVDQDGRFMRLFRYIDGANQQEQKVSMTTPVFMDPENKPSDGQMSFVIPQQTEVQGIPVPTGENVRIQQREGGRFAVYRFSGRMNQTTTAQAEQKLRDWMKHKGLNQSGSFESAGYDPPWTPGPFRRNEVLIRLEQAVDTTSND